jgi:hypothetical protein
MLAFSPKWVLLVPAKPKLRPGSTGEVAGVAAAVGRRRVGVGRPEVAMVLCGGVTVEVSLPVGVTAPPVWVWWSGPVPVYLGGRWRPGRGRSRWRRSGRPRR